ncbi:hypothetical protein CHS0354_022778 [Potamilus streckersoni]|uniref:NACHT domain-containing protein n=1 Tax=Potamilus streckersoni TaxID=2493646 RepID=A0AAE0S1P2_9BIVA|nr:hypothetical protein CHS0354_022778 [Potamilus streckersoni]
MSSGTSKGGAGVTKNIGIKGKDQRKDEKLEQLRDITSSTPGYYLKKLSQKLENLNNTTPDLVKQIQLKNEKHVLSETEKKALQGDIDIECPTLANIVRIFTSSTFTDTKEERNYLMIDAYPRLKEFCQQLGYDFQVVDMRWGVTNEATDDHMGTDLCLQELARCQKLSTGPNFVSLLSHKYGYRPLPRSIPATDFEPIIQSETSTMTKSLFSKWYHRDENAVPAEYALDPISTHLRSKTDWLEESENLHTALENAALEVLGREKARQYFSSVTEKEVRMGMLETQNRSDCCCWLKRSFKGIEDVSNGSVTRRFIDCVDPSQKEMEKATPEEKIKLLEKARGLQERARALHRELRDDLMIKCIAKERLKEYEINWTEKGIDLDHPEHKKYLKDFNDDFVVMIKNMIETALRKKQTNSDTLLEEVFQHVRFCQKKCELFHGREESLKKIKDYITGKSREVFVVHGQSGSGKTSILAMTARDIKKRTSGTAVLLLRFLGTSPDSTSIIPLLTSLLKQLNRIFNDNRPVPTNFQELVREFHHSLAQAGTQRHTVVMLDSLDQLDPSNNAQQLTWLPKPLPDNVKIVVSTLPDDKYECFPVLKSMVAASENFLDVPNLQEADVISIIDTWLSFKKRTLTESQRNLVKERFNTCPSPLFLKLCLDEAVRWKSFSGKDMTVLQMTVRKSIDTLFKKLEGLHGTLLVSKALGYLTCSQRGLSESELEDILSCDDDVLNEIFTYWTPPVRRLPPLLLVRLRADLDQYLVDRGADGVRVFFWYHRQFFEAAIDFYCSNEKTNAQLHCALGDFFAGRWASGRKKRNEKDGTEEDRHVSQQPLLFDNTINYRKLNNLPYHRIMSRQLEPAKVDCLCNFEFLFFKLKATDIEVLRTDFLLAAEIFPNDDLIRQIRDALQLSQEALVEDPNQLGPQLIQRIPPSKDTSEFLEQCRRNPLPHLLPNQNLLRQTGDELTHCLAGHSKGGILQLDITTDGKMAVTCGDGEVCIWDLHAGKLLRTHRVDNVFDAKFCLNNTHMILHTQTTGEKDTLSIREVITGRVKLDVLDSLFKKVWCLVGNGCHRALTMEGNDAVIYDLNDGSRSVTARMHGQGVDKEDDGVEFERLIGSSNFCLYTCDEKEEFFMKLLDLRSMKIVISRRILDIRYSMTISTDERYVIFKDTSFHLMDTTTKAIRVILTTLDPELDVGWIYGTSLDGQQLYINAYVDENFYVLIYDMKTGKSSLELPHPKIIYNVRSVDGKCIVTIESMGVLRIWDRSRYTKKNNYDKESGKISEVHVLPNSRYCIGLSTANKTIIVHDMIQQKTVREAIFDVEITTCLPIDSKLAIIIRSDVKDGQKIHDGFLIDLDAMKCLKRYHPFKGIQQLYAKKSEMAALTGNKLGVKCMEVRSAKVTGIVHVGEIIETTSVNEDSYILTAYTEKRKVHVCDLKSRRVVRTIETGTELKGTLQQLSRDNKYLMLNYRKKEMEVTLLPGGGETEEEVARETLFIWDVENGRMTVDFSKLENYKIDHLYGINSWTVIGQREIFVAPFRESWYLKMDFTTGKVLERTKDKLPFDLVCVSQTEELLLLADIYVRRIFVLKKKDLKHVASFNMDYHVKRFPMLSKDGRFVVGCTISGQIVKWEILPSDNNRSTYPTDFKERKGPVLKLSINSMKPEGSDPENLK